jgi:hypothetical protein
MSADPFEWRSECIENRASPVSMFAAFFAAANARRMFCSDTGLPSAVQMTKSSVS